MSTDALTEELKLVEEARSRAAPGQPSPGTSRSARPRRPG
jgi:hypothetical protein